jgi:Bacterial Ig-like domain (group 3)
MLRNSLRRYTPTCEKLELRRAMATLQVGGFISTHITMGSNSADVRVSDGVESSTKLLFGPEGPTGGGSNFLAQANLFERIDDPPTNSKAYIGIFNLLNQPGADQNLSQIFDGSAATLIAATLDIVPSQGEVAGQLVGIEFSYLYDYRHDNVSRTGVPLVADSLSVVGQNGYSNNFLHVDSSVINPIHDYEDVGRGGLFVANFPVGSRISLEGSFYVSEDKITSYDFITDSIELRMRVVPPAPRLTDLAVSQPTWTAGQGVTFDYTISGANLTQAATVGLYWSADTTYNPGQDEAAFTTLTQTATGTYTVSPTFDNLTPPSAGSNPKYLLAVIDPSNAVAESDEPGGIMGANNVQPLLLSEPDLVATALAWNTAQGGVDFSYEVQGSVLTQDTTAALYWASGTTTDTILEPAATPITISQSTPIAAVQTVHVPWQELQGGPPPDGKYLLLELNPDHSVIESDAANDTNDLLSLLNGGDTTTVVTSSAPLFSVYSQSVTFTATVKAKAPGGGIPTGTVTFLNDSVFGSPPLGPPVQLSSDPNNPGFATAVFTTNKLGLGATLITAVYGGDIGFTSSISNTMLQTVVPDTTTLTLTAHQTSVYGQEDTFTAKLTADQPGRGTPTGYVTFAEGSTVLGRVNLSHGTASFVTTKLTAGAHIITALYGGDGNFTGSPSVSVTQDILKAEQTIVWSDPDPIGYGTPLGAAQLKATVSGVPGGSLPGALTYTPPAGTVLPTGMHQALTVSAAATTNYNAATFTVYIDVLTVAQQDAKLIQDVVVLVPTTLNSGQADALTSHLDLKGNNGDAHKVEAFINQVNAFRRAGILTAGQADALIKKANMLLVTLSLV